MPPLRCDQAPGGARNVSGGCDRFGGVKRRLRKWDESVAGLSDAPWQTGGQFAALRRESCVEREGRGGIAPYVLNDTFVVKCRSALSATLLGRMRKSVRLRRRSRAAGGASGPHDTHTFGLVGTRGVRR